MRQMEPGHNTVFYQGLKDSRKKTETLKSSSKKCGKELHVIQDIFTSVVAERGFNIIYIQ